MKKQTDPPTPVEPPDGPLDIERMIALVQENSRQTFHLPTRQKHWRGSAEEAAADAEAVKKKRRKIAKASAKANRKYANKKRKRSRPGRHR